MHYQRADGEYDDWGLYTWGDIDPAHVDRRGRPGSRSPGRTPTAGSPGSSSSRARRRVGFLVVDKDGTKDVASDRTIDSTRTGEIWLKQGDPAIYPSRQAAAGEPDPPVDEGTAVLHYRRADGDYDGWGLHLWDGAANPTDWANPLLPAGDGRVRRRLPGAAGRGATGLSYIVHKGDEKDLPDDQSLDFGRRRPRGVAARRHAGLPAAADRHGRAPDTRPRPRPRRTGSTGPPWPGRPARPTASRTPWSSRPTGGLSVGGRRADRRRTPTLPLTAQRNGLTEAQRAKFPHLWQYRAFTLDPRDAARCRRAARAARR